MTRSQVALTLLAAAILAPLNCRKAEGVENDPLDREAEVALVEYVKIDTSNPPGNETAGAKFLQQLFVKEGIEVKLVGSDPNRQSVYAKLSSGTNEKALLLMHHIDVVPAVANEWTKPPFSGDQSGGYIFGRGALDVKSLGVANMIAMIDLKRRNARLRRDIIFLGVADEELGGLRGCKELLEKNPELFANVGFVLNEGGYNETAVDKITFWGIETQQKVPLWLRLNVKGMPGHAASPPPGGGTIAKLVRVLDEVMKIETPYRLTPEVKRYFRDAGRSRPGNRGDVMRAIKEPLDIKQIEEVLPPGYRSMLQDTIVLTRVSGGAAPNSIPARASADVDIRLLPGTKIEPMLERVKSSVGKSAEVEVLLAGEPGPETSSDTELFRLLAKAMKEDEPGSDVAAIVGGGTSDSRFFRARGIPAYGIAPFKVNYYDADSVHGTDERIRARFFIEGTRLVRKIVADFCVRAK
ncbi:MAG: M20/M25/M40 family metallo-hydrolase [Thermoanaerobaculia bacterium]|nr:M20/M25/M40 family metallo-hydrolase [Thermoanaerobaculia bacterium]